MKPDRFLSTLNHRCGPPAFELRVGRTGCLEAWTRERSGAMYRVRVIQTEQGHRREPTERDVSKIQKMQRWDRYKGGGGGARKLVDDLYRKQEADRMVRDMTRIEEIHREVVSPYAHHVIGTKLVIPVRPGGDAHLPDRGRVRRHTIHKGAG